MLGWSKVVVLSLIVFCGCALALGQDKHEHPLVQIGFFPVTNGMSALPDGTVVGKDADKIRGFLADKPVRVEWVEMPWVRLYRLIHTRPNMLISNLLRTPDREEKFHWLLLLEEEKHFLISRNQEEFSRLTQAEIASSTSTAVCDQESAQCAMLQALGFPEERIMQVYSMTSGDHARLVASGRVDFMIENLEAIEPALAENGIATDALIHVLALDSSATYLAAPKSIDPGLLELLTQ